MNKLYPPGPKPGAGGRVKNHCRKFWWCGRLYRHAGLVDIVADRKQTALSLSSSYWSLYCL